jgi:hypothetical protein
MIGCEALQNVRTPFIDLINNNNYNFKHLDIREQFIPDVTQYSFIDDKPGIIRL